MDGKTVLCKKSYYYDSKSFIFNENCQYNIINDTEFYYEIESDNYFKTKYSYSASISGILTNKIIFFKKEFISLRTKAPGDLFSDYFYTKQEIRKLKLKKIDGKM